MTPKTEKRLAEIRMNLREIKMGAHPSVADYIADVESCLSIIDGLRAENERLKSHPAIITYPEEEKG